jgi:hypothetical protein
LAEKDLPRAWSGERLHRLRREILLAGEGKFRERQSGSGKERLRRQFMLPLR